MFWIRTLWLLAALGGYSALSYCCRRNWTQAMCSLAVVAMSLVATLAI